MTITQVGTLQKPGSVSTHRKYYCNGSNDKIISVNEYFIFKHSNGNLKSLDRSKSHPRSLIPSSYCLCHLVWHSNILHYEHGVHSCVLYETQNKRRLFLHEVFTDSFYEGGAVYRAVQTEYSSMTKLNLVFKLSGFCHNANLQTQNLNRMFNFLVCCMSPAVHFLLPYLLHFL